MRCLRRGSYGCVQGVCHTPLQFPQNQYRQNYIGCRKNYIGHRKNYIRHNSNYIGPFLPDCNILKNKNIQGTVGRGQSAANQRLVKNRWACVVIHPKGKNAESVLRFIPCIEIPAFVEEEGGIHNEAL